MCGRSSWNDQAAFLELLGDPLQWFLGLPSPVLSWGSRGDLTGCLGTFRGLPASGTFGDPMRHRSCGLFGQGRAFQVRLHRFAARADARTSPSCVVFIPPGRPSTPIHTIRSVVCRSEHLSCRFLRDSRSVPQACSIRRSDCPLPDKHCYYDPIASPCGVGVDAEKGAMPALDLQSLAALRIGWLQTS